jgi:hypothetical protein
MLADDYQAVREDVAAFRERIRIAIESSMDEGESPAIESSAAENEESESAGCQFSDSLPGESLGGITAPDGEAPGEDAISSIEEESEIDQELRAFAAEMRAFRQSFEDAITGEPSDIADPEIVEKLILTERLCKLSSDLAIEVAGACRLATGKALYQCSIDELNLFLDRMIGLAKWIGGIDDLIPEEELDEGEKAANNYGQQFIAQFLRDGQVDEKAIANLPDEKAIANLPDDYGGEECPECKGKGHFSEKEYWDEECQTSFPEDDEAWCRKCYGSGLFPPPQRLAATVEVCLFRRAQKVANELGFQYLARENKHMIIRENFIEAYSTAEGAIEGMREAVLIDAEKTLLKAAIDSLCYEMAMSKLPANNICVSVTGNTIEDCSVDDLKIFLNHLRYIEKVALGSHQDNRHTN